MLQLLALSRLEKMIWKSNLPFFTCADWISVKPPNTTVENLNSRAIVTNYHVLKNSATAKLALWVRLKKFHSFITKLFLWDNFSLARKMPLCRFLILHLFACLHSNQTLGSCCILVIFGESFSLFSELWLLYPDLFKISNFIFFYFIINF